MLHCTNIYFAHNPPISGRLNLNKQTTEKIAIKVKLRPILNRIPIHDTKLYALKHDENSSVVSTEWRKYAFEDCTDVSAPISPKMTIISNLFSTVTIWKDEKYRNKKLPLTWAAIHFCGIFLSHLMAILLAIFPSAFSCMRYEERAKFTIFWCVSSTQK